MKIKKSSPLVLIIVLVLFLLGSTAGIFYLALVVLKPAPPAPETIESKPSDDPSQQSPSSSGGTQTEVLVLRAEGIVGPDGKSWETPRIDYKFKIRTEGHAITLQFTGLETPVSYPPEGDFQMPTGAQQGPVVIKADSAEIREFRVQLYEKRTVTLR